MITAAIIAMTDGFLFTMITVVKRSCIMTVTVRTDLQ